jgi:hypothetical protein
MHSSAYVFLFMEKIVGVYDYMYILCECMLLLITGYSQTVDNGEKLMKS